MFPDFDNSVLQAESQDGRLAELHLYNGSRCNRECAFCCVNGAPNGWHVPFSDQVLKSAVAIVSTRGSLKLFGGEPTLDSVNLRWTLRRLRTMGFEGAVTIFSNGIRATHLVELLTADSRLFLVLNRAIATGQGEAPMPPASLQRLQAFDRELPGRIFLSHDFTVPVGRQDAESASVEPGQPCYRCFPTLTSDGRFHACPFAVEYDNPQYKLGVATDNSEIVQQRFRHFLSWVDRDVNTKASLTGRSACEICVASHVTLSTDS